MQRLREQLGGDDSADGTAEYVVLGDGRLGVSIARRLRAAGHTVGLVDERRDATGLPGVTGRPDDRRVLERAGLTDRTTVVVATPRDRRNLLIAGLVRAHFDVADCLVLVNNPDRVEAVAAADHEALCVTSELSAVVTDRLAERAHGAEDAPARTSEGGSA
jgi:Trk K+ transport system NAD-binding subunit